MSERPSIFNIEPGNAIDNPYSIDGTPLLLSFMPGSRPGLLLKDPTGELDDIEAAIMCQRITSKYQGAATSSELLKKIAREIVVEYEKVGSER